MLSFYFTSRLEAESVIIKLFNFAKDYGYATIADLKILQGRIHSSREDHHKGWTADMLHSIPIKRSACGWRVDLPDPICIEKEGKSDHCIQPIFITIHTNELDVHDPDKIIETILEKANEIKDRTINITIM